MAKSSKVKLTIWISPDCDEVIRLVARQVNGSFGEVVEACLKVAKDAHFTGVVKSIRKFH